MSTAINLLKGLHYIRIEVKILDQRIKRQHLEMQGISSARLGGITRSHNLPEGLERMVAKKDELERAQEKSIVRLYEQMKAAEELLRTEDDPQMRLLMRLLYVEEKKLHEVSKCMYVSKATAERINKRVKEKYGAQTMTALEGE